MKAKKFYSNKITFPDGSFISAIIWELSEPTPDRPHGYKYRLNYCTADGVTMIRYDNKLGKGDHKHIYNEQYPLQFETIDQLLNDFLRDVFEIVETRIDEKSQ